MPEKEENFSLYFIFVEYIYIKMVG